MIAYFKDILGIASNNVDYDAILVVVCGITLAYILKSVITALYQTVLHIFR